MPTLGFNRKHEMATKRLDETAWRWVRAGRMLLAGKTPAQAAHAASVARQTAYSWKAVLEDGEIDALRVMPTRGWRSRLHSVGATLAEVLRTLGPAHLREHALSTVQARARRATVACRTPALGGTLQQCGQYTGASTGPRATRSSNKRQSTALHRQRSDRPRTDSAAECPKCASQPADETRPSCERIAHHHPMVSQRQSAGNDQAQGRWRAGPWPQRRSGAASFVTAVTTTHERRDQFR